jgi:predicted glycosyltransferase
MSLTLEFATGSVLLTTGSTVLTATPPSARVEVVRIPALPSPKRARPLQAARVERLRQRLLCKLFDVFRPDLLVLDLWGEVAEDEARLLLQRARALGTAALLGVEHDRIAEPCFAGEEEPWACAECRAHVCASAREALRRGLG